MPRFFFDFRQAGTLTPDSAGLEFESVEQAYLEAFNGAREMWGELLRQRQDPRRCSFEVRDAGDRLLFILPFQEILETCAERRVADGSLTVDQIRATFEQAGRVTRELHSEMNRTHRVLRESRALLGIAIGDKVP